MIQWSCWYLKVWNPNFVFQFFLSNQKVDRFFDRILGRKFFHSEWCFRSEKNFPALSIQARFWSHVVPKYRFLWRFFHAPLDFIDGKIPTRIENRVEKIDWQTDLIFDSTKKPKKFSTNLCGWRSKKKLVAQIEVLHFVVYWMNIFNWFIKQIDSILCCKQNVFILIS